MTTAHSPHAKPGAGASAPRYAGSLVALIALHVAGAHEHQWIDRDNLLARMLP